MGCTVADSNIVQLMRRHFPHLEVAMNLTPGQNLGWYAHEDFNALAEDAREWMNSVAGNESIGRRIQETLLARTFGCVRFVWNAVLRYLTDAFFERKEKNRLQRRQHVFDATEKTA